MRSRMVILTSSHVALNSATDFVFRPARRFEDERGDLAPPQPQTMAPQNPPNTRSWTRELK